MLIGVHHGGESQLAHAVEAAHAPARFLGGGQGWEKHAGEDANDGNHDEQFNQRESRAFHDRR
jgi:hypothetical protein